MAETGVADARLRFCWRVAGIIMLGVVWWGCLTPSPPYIPQPFDYFDKFEHWFAYFVLGAWFAAIYSRRPQRMAVLILLIAMGGIIEILQHFTGRDAEWFDWFADIVGALLGVAWPAVWLERLYRYLVVRYAGHF